LGAPLAFLRSFRVPRRRHTWDLLNARLIMHAARRVLRWRPRAGRIRPRATSAAVPEARRGGGWGGGARQGHDAGKAIWCAAFSPDADNRLVVTGGEDEKVCVWETATGRCLAICEVRPAWAPVGCTLGGSRAGRLLASVSAVVVESSFNENQLNRSFVREETLYSSGGDALGLADAQPLPPLP
jgi:WD40 repeat protein